VSLELGRSPDDGDGEAPDADAGTTGKPGDAGTDRPAPGHAGSAAKPALGGSGAPPTAARVPTTQFRLLSTMPPDPDEDEPAAAAKPDAAKPAAGGTDRVVPGELADTAETADSDAGGSGGADTAGTPRLRTGTAERAPSDDAADTTKPGAGGAASAASIGAGTPPADSPDTARLRTGSAERAPSDDAADTAKLRTGGGAADTARLTGGSARRPPSGAAAGPSRLATGRLDGPLLADTAGLRASWHRVQASFVDHPRAAVSDAADLVEHTAQALIGALRLRQNQLRGMWEIVGQEADGASSRTWLRGRGRSGGSRWDDDGGLNVAGGGLARERAGESDGAPPADGSGESAGGPVPDSTEQLRLVMQRYRALFNQICRP